MPSKLKFYTCIVAALAIPGSVVAAVPQRLSLSTAMEAVKETISVCQAEGYNVAVAVVDPDGVIQIQARGDGSPIHSQRFAYRKAYTVMSMGPMFGVETSGELTEKITSVNPVGIANISAGSTELLFLPGGVLIKSAGEPIAAIGVSGAPKSAQDEACANAGLNYIKMRLVASRD